MAEILSLDGNGEKYYELLTDAKRRDFMAGIFNDIISEDESIHIKDAGNEDKLHLWAQAKIKNLLLNNDLKKHLLYQPDLWRAESEAALKKKVTDAVWAYLKIDNVPLKTYHKE